MRPGESGGSTTTLTSCPVLYSTTSLSFWGGIDPRTGIIIDTSHPLVGHCVTNTALCIPSGRGSCTGSQVLLELILNGIAPSAIITRDRDAILCVSAIVAEEFFTDNHDNDANEEEELMLPEGGVPIIVAVGAEEFANLDGGKTMSITRYDNSNNNLNNNDDDDGKVCIHYIDNKDDRKMIVTKDLLRLKDTLLHHNHSTYSAETSTTTTISLAEEKALRTIQRVASIHEATELIPVTSAHIDAVTYIGQGGLQFARRLVQLGGKVKVTTTMNAQSCDRRRWSALGIDPKLANNANSVGDAYLNLGCELSFTCAPYLLPTRPTMGEDIVWGESNAVVYANSVIGARTEKYADYLDILGAIVGRVPKVGVHIESNRSPTVIIDATELIMKHLLPRCGSKCSDEDNDYDDDKNEIQDDIDSFFPVLGWICGNLSDGGVPLILGFDLMEVTNDNLKAFCAAFGTTGSGESPLFHMANVTPEAIGKNTIERMLHSCGGRRVEVTVEHLCTAYETLDSGNDGSDDISLVALGNPHLSIEELGFISSLINRDDRPKHKDIDIIATLGRHIHSQGEKLGYIQNLDAFGVQFINDTCWCMLLDPPIIPSNPNAKILTNSAKYAHYGTGLTNRRLRFGSMNQCIEVAKSGKMNLMNGNSDGLPHWLRSCTQRLVRTIKFVK